MNGNLKETLDKAMRTMFAPIDNVKYDSDPRGGFLWRPAGYLSRKNAAWLAPHWLTIRGIPVILQATLVSQSDYHAQLSWFSEYNSEVKFRDIDYLFSDFLAGDSYA